MASKEIFTHGQIVEPLHANAWQNPQWVSREDYPIGTTQWDLQEGEYFVPPVHIEKDLVGFNSDPDTFLSGDGILKSPWGGRVTDKPIGYAHTAPFHTVDVSAGCVIDTEGVKRCWNASPVQVVDGQVSYIYIDNAGNINVDNELPGRIVPHTALGKVTASGDLTQIEDLRPHAAVGAHNDTPLQLINTEVKTADYTAKTWERVLVNSSGGAFTIFLPANPTDGDQVAMLDVGGVLASFPVVIASQKEIVGEIATAIQAINQESKDWIFNSNYTYISLVWSEAENSWFFQEVPDGNCDPTPGAFIRCGGAHPTIDSPVTCAAEGFNWNTNRQQCLLPNTFGVYAGKDAGEIYFVEKDKACRCAYKLDPGAKCPEEKGEFLYCNNGHGFYADGDGGTVRLLQDPVCLGGSQKGEFVRCDGNDAVYVRDNNPADDDGLTFTIPRHPQCMQGNQSTWFAKRGFLEDYMQPVIDYLRVGSGGEEYFNENDESEGFIDLIEEGFGSSAENGRSIERPIIRYSDAPNIDEAAWARVRVFAKCAANPCAVRTRVYLEFLDRATPSNSATDKRIWIAETTFHWTPGDSGIGFGPPGSSNIIWVPLPSYWKRFVVRYTAWGAKAPNDEQSARVSFFTRRQAIIDRHYNDY